MHLSCDDCRVDPGNYKAPDDDFPRKDGFYVELEDWEAWHYEDIGKSAIINDE
jgi:hypothetical protein